MVDLIRLLCFLPLLMLALPAMWVAQSVQALARVFGFPVAMGMLTFEGLGWFLRSRRGGVDRVAA